MINVAGAGGIIGAKQLKNSKPDGRTLGILNASSLIISELLGTKDSPRLTEDFAILGSFGKESDVWLASARSKIRTIDDIFAKASHAPVIFGAAAIGSGVAQRAAALAAATAHVVGEPEPVPARGGAIQLVWIVTNEHVVTYYVEPSGTGGEAISTRSGEATATVVLGEEELIEVLRREIGER